MNCMQNIQIYNSLTVQVGKLPAVPGMYMYMHGQCSLCIGIQQYLLKAILFLSKVLAQIMTNII